MKQNWVIRKENPKLRDNLSQGLQISPITAQLLVNRGIESEAEGEFFLKTTLFDMPSPFLLKGMEKACERIAGAIKSGEKIAVYGDYDVDGVTSTSLVYTFLSSLGSDVVYYNPDRFNEGYGVNSAAVRKLREQGVTLIISGDCGITAWKEVEEAKSLGVDFIVTDHHQPPEILPDAVAVLNPLQPGCRYPAKEIVGVGVSFNLVVALRRVLREDGFFEGEEPNLGDYLDLVALGTVADCAELVNVNRLFVKEGIKRMHNPKRPGLHALKEVSRLNGEITSADIGFRLGPRINAAGRLKSAKIAVELLISEDMEQAQKIAQSLESENSERQKIQGVIYDDVLFQLNSSPDRLDSLSLVLSSSKWHPGVIGIVASKVVEKFGKPTVLIAIDEDGFCRGSARSVEGVDIYAALAKCSSLFEDFGGHKLAAGISIRAEKIDEFTASFESAVSGLDGESIQKILIDSAVDPAGLGGGFLDELLMLEPFGPGNPEPVFVAKSQTVVSSNTLKEKHVQLTLRSKTGQYKAMWFNADTSRKLSGEIDIVLSPEVNFWRGRKDLRFRVVDLD